MMKKARRGLMRVPHLGKGVYVDPSAQVIGRVRIGSHSSLWPGCVLRGDINTITIGHHTNLQDLTIVHVESDRPCKIGNHVTVGHGVILHACTVRDESLIGMGSIVLDGAVIEKHVLLGAGSLVTPHQRLRSGYLYLGRPAKAVRRLTAREIREIKASARRYVLYAQQHNRGLLKRLAPLTQGGHDLRR